MNRLANYRASHLMEHLGQWPPKDIANTKCSLFLKLRRLPFLKRTFLGLQLTQRVTNETTKLPLSFRLSARLSAGYISTTVICRQLKFSEYIFLMPLHQNVLKIMGSKQETCFFSCMVWNASCLVQLSLDRFSIFIGFFILGHMFNGDNFKTLQCYNLILFCDKWKWSFKQLPMPVFSNISFYKKPESAL